MTEDKLKGWVAYRRRIPMGTYATADFEWGEEYWKDEMTLEQAFADLKSRVDRLLHVTGLFHDPNLEVKKL